MPSEQSASTPEAGPSKLNPLSSRPQPPAYPHPHLSSINPAISLREPHPSDLLPETNPSPQQTRPTLADFRRSEGPTLRSQKLKALWSSLPVLPEPCSGPTETKLMRLPGQDTPGILSPERAERLKRLYEEELARRVTLEERDPEARLWGGDDSVAEPGANQPSPPTNSTNTSLPMDSQLPSGPEDNDHSRGYKGKGVNWRDFRRFLWDQEKELWDTFQELDKDGDGRLSKKELRQALDKNGIEMTDSTLKDFVTFLASGSPASRVSSSSPTAFPADDRKDKTYVTFAEFRDFLILLPRKASVPEIYKFYQVRRRFGDGRGAARVNMDGDLSVSFPKAASGSSNSPPPSPSRSTFPTDSTKVDSKKGKSKATNESEGHGDDSAEPAKAVSGADAGGAGVQVDGRKLLDEALEDDGEERDEGGEGAYEDDEDEDAALGIGGNVAWKFLLAGGIAGAVSRTATAPFDRLKVYLITTIDPSTTHQAGSHLFVSSKNLAGAGLGGKHSVDAVKKTFLFGKKGWGHLQKAVLKIYREGGGVGAFWVGNGLNVTKIFPESAIKFFSYEYSKRLFARYWDLVPDQSDISGTSRFISGGIGGITSQLSIYPIETLKTQLQSSHGSTKGQLLPTIKHMWKSGGVRAYYRGLTLGLIGVFPYSAIDMSTFEALKIAYCKSFELEEPQTLAVLCFGALSGSIGATSVYPINLLRTRLQASGSAGHPQVYTGFKDVAMQTLSREGWPGLYKGLVPTLAKVAPSVSLSYLVYESSKKYLQI